MLAGLAALVTHRVELLLVVLFSLALQANFFSPAKYGILPELTAEAQLSRANGLVELTTFAAIVLGTTFGAFLNFTWSGEPGKMGGMLLAIAIVGALATLRIRHVAPAGSTEPFRWNPFHEVWLGVRRLGEERGLKRVVWGISYFWFAGSLIQMTALLAGAESLHAAGLQTGLVVAMLALGIGVGSIAAGTFSRNQIELGLVPVGAALLGVSCLAFSFTHSVAWAAAPLFAIGFAGGLFIVPLNAYLQEYAGSHEKGRLQATNNFMNMLGVILASGILRLLHDGLHWSAMAIVGALGAVTLVGGLAAAAALPIAVLRFFISTTLHTIFKIRVIGRENFPRAGSALFVSNHVSYADAFLIGCCGNRLIRYLIFAPIYKTKILQPLLNLFRVIPVSQTAPKEMLRALKTARQALNAGDLVGIFPEGSITRTGYVLDFQRGVERLIDEETKVVPAYLEGLWGSPLSAKGDKLFKNWFRLPLRREVIVVIGEPMTGPVSAEQLRSRVLELSHEAISALAMDEAA